MRGAWGAGHFVFPLPGFDFGTSWHIIVVDDFQCLLQSAPVHIHFAIHVFCSQFQWFVLAPVIIIVTSDIFQTGSNKFLFFNGVEINKILINCTHCCIIINFSKLYHTETEFIWRTLLNMSQGTANPKQNLQNDMCILGRLRSDYAVRVVWSEAEQRLRWRSPGFLAGIQWLTWLHRGTSWSEFLLGLYTFLFVLASSPRPDNPQFSHFRMASRFTIYYEKKISYISYQISYTGYKISYLGYKIFIISYILY